MVVGAFLYAVVEYLLTTDWRDESIRFVDPVYDRIRGPGRSRRR